MLTLLGWQDVAEAIASWACGRLGDYVRHFPDGEASGPLEAYVQLLSTLHAATGHDRDLPEVCLAGTCCAGGRWIGQTLSDAARWSGH